MAVRATPEEAREDLDQSEGSRFLVCAYEDEAKCREVGLRDSMPLTEFRERLPSVPRDARIYFY